MHRRRLEVPITAAISSALATRSKLLGVPFPPLVRDAINMLNNNYLPRPKTAQRSAYVEVPITTAQREFVRRQSRQHHISMGAVAHDAIELAVVIWDAERQARTALIGAATVQCSAALPRCGSAAAVMQRATFLKAPPPP